MSNPPTIQTLPSISIVGHLTHEDGLEAYAAAIAFLQAGHKRGHMDNGRGCHVFVRTNKRSITVERLYPDVGTSHGPCAASETSAVATASELST